MGDGVKGKIHWVNWFALCDSKRDGGMGFRDLRSFNLALLRKQVWRIILFPHSLLSRIFKAKYFPHCDVLDSIPKANASFTWKSISSAIVLIRHGIRMRIGNGIDTNVWSDN